MSDARPTRILFVDDEDTIRLTLPSILRMHGWDVTACGTVPEALDCIQKERFDVLLADLNIGQPGDGFTVVSAMRRTQPKAVTIIITGYPAFETALEAIRQQVDDYIVKPTNIPNLLETIEQCLRDRRPHHPLPLQRLAAIIRHYSTEIVAEWLALSDADREIAAIPLDHHERAEHVPGMLIEVINMLEQHRGEISYDALQAATRHGEQRRAQQYTVEMLLKENRLLRRAVLATVQQHLLEVNISFLLSDLIALSESLDIQVHHSLKAFLGASAETRVA